MSITQIEQESPTKIFRAGLKPLAVKNKLGAHMAQSPLSVSTYSTIFQKSESLSIIKESFIPQNASEKEKKIHKFLDSMKAFQVCIKFMMEEENKQECKSPRLQKELSLQKRATSPGFLAKRMIMKNATLKTGSSFQGENTPSGINSISTFGSATQDSEGVLLQNKSLFINSKGSALSHRESTNKSDQLQLGE